MDKYEYKHLVEQIQSLIDQGEYAQAAEIADKIDWRRVRSVMTLGTISDLYKINGRYEDARDIMLLAYDRKPDNRQICYSLCELYIKTGEPVEAAEFYKEFEKLAPKDPGRYVLKYKLYDAYDVSLDEKIEVLEKLKEEEYQEKWMYELANLYHRRGLGTKCVEVCDEIILWFGSGKYVNMAMELKMLHEPLTAEQRRKYESRNQVQEPAPREQKMRQPAQAPVVTDPVVADQRTIAYPMGSENAVPKTTHEWNADEVVRGSEDQMGETRIFNPEEVRRQLNQGQSQDEYDIQVKTVDVSQYNTMNLQAELAEGLKEILEKQDTEKEAPQGTVDSNTRVFQPVMNSDSGPLDMPVMEDVEEEDLEAEPVKQRASENMENSEVFFEASGQMYQDENGYFHDASELEKAAMTAQPPEAMAKVLTQEPDGQLRLVMPESKRLEKQITGQMSIDDVRIEWERMKLESQAKQEEEVRQQVLRHTGKMFTEFEEAIRDNILRQMESTIDPASFAESKPEEQEDAAYNTETSSEWNFESVSDTKYEPIEEVEAPAEVNKAIVEAFAEAPVEEVMPSAVREEAAEEVEETAADAVQEATEAVVEATEEVTETIADTAEEVTEATAEVTEEVTEAAADTAEEVTEATADVAEEVTETIADTAEEATEAFADIAEEVTEATADFAEEVTETVAEAVEEVTETAVEEAAKAPDETVAEESGESEGDAPEDSENNLGYVLRDSYSWGDEAIEEEEYEDASKRRNMFARQEAETSKAEETDGSVFAFVKKPVEEVQEDTESFVKRFSMDAADEDFSMENDKGFSIRRELYGNDQKEAESEPNLFGVREEPTVETENVFAPEKVDDFKAEEEPAKEEEAPTKEEAEALAAAMKAAKEPPAEKARPLTAEEEALYDPWIRDDSDREQLSRAIDGISMAAYTGNVFISGDAGLNTVGLAKKIIYEIKTSDSNFSGKVAKISGAALNKTDVVQLMEGLKSGALIIEDANSMPEKAIRDMQKSLLRENWGIVVMLLDTKKNAKKFWKLHEDLRPLFNINIDIQPMSNDALAEYAKQYAKDREYSIDNLGMLALHMKIDEMQSARHAVNTEDIKEVMDDAILSASRKTLKHFVDILTGKRYDDEDMIIITEKDFQ